MKLKSIIFAILLLALTVSSANRIFGQSYSGPVMVMPFENTSDSENPKYNWVGESFAVLLPDLFEVGGVRAISNGDRRTVQQRLRIPMSSLPSLAAAIKMARENGATLLVTGTFKIIQGKSEGSETIIASARVIDVRSGKIVGVRGDSRESSDSGAGNSIDTRPASGSLKGEVEVEAQGSDDLGTLIGEAADRLLKQLQGSGAIARKEDLINVANKVPPDAFEAYVKGVSAGDSDDQIKAGFFRRAVEIYAREKSGEMYNEAALELGHLYLKQSRLDDALYYFSRVPPISASSPEAFKVGDRKLENLSSEAAFYMAWIYWSRAKVSESLALLRPLSDKLRNPAVTSMYGGIAVHAGKFEKSGRSDEFLTQGIGALRSAVESAPENRNALFNLGLALFIKGDYKASSDVLRKFLDAGIKVNSKLLPSDGDAQFLLAKALGEIPGADAAEVTTEDNKARELLTIDKRYANLQLAWSNQKSVDMINVRVRMVERSEFRSIVIEKAMENVRRANRQDEAPDETKILIASAKELYNSNQDEKARELLVRANLADPMNAEAYHLLGMIYLRNRDVDKAVNNFRIAIFFREAYFEPYVPLVKIYVEKGKCIDAQQYLGLAKKNFPQMAELGSLQRLVDRCSTK